MHSRSALRLSLVTAICPPRQAIDHRPVALNAQIALICRYGQRIHVHDL
jgi:hypothetical protein